MQTLKLQHVRSSSLTRGRTWARCIGRAVLATGPPGKSQYFLFITFFFFTYTLHISFFLYLWLHWDFVVAHRLSLAADSRGCPLVLVLRLLIVVASCGTQALGAQASVVVAHGLSSCDLMALGCSGFHCCGISSVITELYLALWDPMSCTTPGLPVHHQLPEPTQTHVR